MSFGITELLIVLLIVILLFGTKKIRTMGGDLGNAIKSFKRAVEDESSDKEPLISDMEGEETQNVIESEIKPVTEEATKADPGR